MQQPQAMSDVEAPLQSYEDQQDQSKPRAQARAQAHRTPAQRKTAVEDQANFVSKGLKSQRKFWVTCSSFETYGAKVDEDYVDALNVSQKGVGLCKLSVIKKNKHCNDIARQIKNMNKNFSAAVLDAQKSTYRYTRTKRRFQQLKAADENSKKAQKVAKNARLQSKNARQTEDYSEGHPENYLKALENDLSDSDIEEQDLS